MSKKAFITAGVMALALFSLVLGMHTEVANANPYFSDTSVSLTPGSEPPRATILNPVYSVGKYFPGGTVIFNLSSVVNVSFAVDATPPVLHIIQPEKKTYDGSDVQLNFTVDEPVSWMGYCLDMATANVTIDGNTTLSGLLTPSSHILQVFANDSMGNMGASDIIGFVTTNPPVSPHPVVTPTQTAAPTTPPATPPSTSPTQQPIIEPSFTPLVGPEPAYWILYTIAGVTAIAVVVLGLLVYRARHKRVKQ